MLPPVSLVIPNYNGAHLLAASLDAVLQATAHYPGAWELILVDDGSTDESLDRIRPFRDRIRLIQHAQNRGFSRAVATGVSAARSEWVVLLNSDVHPQPDFLAPLIRALGAEPDLFAVSPLIEDERGAPLFVSWPRYRLVRGKLRPRPWTRATLADRQARGLPLDGLYASGGSMAFRRDRFLALGGFLPIYRPFYAEDLDLGTRAWMRGWKTRLIPESRVTHGTKGGTIRRYFPARTVRTIRLRNRLIYLCLHGQPRRFFLIHLPWIVLRSLTRLVRWDPTLAAALIQVIALGTRIREERKRLDAEGPRTSLEALLESLP